jgi:2-polyprenyl-3-methyl-5-hydroxy-6-metoxy-1,4-benzoquinol methylase
MTTATVCRCPTCGGDDLRHIHTFSAQQSAVHLIPPFRAAGRTRELEQELRAIWSADTLEILRCSGCGFGFSSPFVAGTGRVYNLIGDGDQHYPGERFEFTETLKVLRECGGVRSLLEIGAGSGAFLRKVIDASLAEAITATEYDDSAVARLRKLPDITVFQADLQTLALQAPAQHNVICMFQVLEHMDRLESVFAALRRLASDECELYIAVPNSDRTAMQERLTGFMDMPPVHIGRWTDKALEIIAGRHGFEVVERRLDPRSALTELWDMAKYGLEARTRRHGLAARVEGISFRPARGVIKRAAATVDLIRLASHYGKIPPATRWFRLRRM